MPADMTHDEINVILDVVDIVQSPVGKQNNRQLNLVYLNRCRLGELKNRLNFTIFFAHRSIHMQPVYGNAIDT